MKVINNILILILLALTLPVFVGCSNNRPSFPVDNNGDVGCSNNRPSFPVDNNGDDEIINNSPDHETNIINYNTLTYENGIKVSSSKLKTDDLGNSIIETGSSIKIKVDLPKYLSITDELFYFDENTNSIISAIKMNDSLISLSELSNNFIINEDTSITLEKSSLNLKSIMFCQKYFTGANDSLYKKFNYISNNFRNSLIKYEDNKIVIDQSVQFISYDSLDKTKESNIINSSSFDTSTKNLNLKIETFLETIEISIVFVYSDKNNNLFLSEVFKSNKFSENKNNKEINSFNCLDNNLSLINIEFAKYYFV